MSLWHNTSTSLKAPPNMQASMPRATEQPHEGGGTANLSRRPQACNPCRERKVRCDREQPGCRRCMQRGKECTYSTGPAKQSVSKSELRQMLLHLQDRLDYAETRGLLPQPSQADQLLYSWPDLEAVGVPGLETSMSNQEHQASVPLSQPEPMGVPLNDSIHVALPTPTMSSSSPFTMNWPNMDMDHSGEFQFGSTVPSIPPLAPGGLPVDILSKLHVAYFEIFDPIMPAISRERFYAQLKHSPVSMPVQALSQAMAMLGALVTPGMNHMVELGYTHTRNLLEMCERQENEADLNTIDMLQACVLLGFYELRRPNLTRATLTLGRGVRLGKMLGFMKVPKVGSNWMEQSQPDLSVSGAQAIEEQRRTVWLLYILDSFAMMRHQSDPVFEEMVLPLPSPGDLANMDPMARMPTISEAFESKDTHAMSTFGGLACVISTYRKCFNHIRASQEDPSYAFWDNHFRIDGLVSKCRACFRSQHTEHVSFSPTEPLSFILYMNLAAVEVSLHKTAMEKSEEDHLAQTSLFSDAEKRCFEAANDITEGLRACSRLPARDLDVFRQASTLFSWATSMAAQVHLWMFNHGRGDRNTQLANLNVLAGVLHEYIGAEQAPPGLLSQMDTVLDNRRTGPTF